jgi:hypothetical protein
VTPPRRERAGVRLKPQKSMGPPMGPSDFVAMVLPRSASTAVTTPCRKLAADRRALMLADLAGASPSLALHPRLIRGRVVAARSLAGRLLAQAVWCLPEARRTEDAECGRQLGNFPTWTFAGSAGATPLGGTAASSTGLLSRPKKITEVVGLWTRPRQRPSAF